MRALNSNIAGDVLTKVVQHLMSEDVGITSIGELPFVTADMLPPSLGLPRIKISQLLRHFLAPQTIDQPDLQPNPSEAGTSAGQSRQSERRTSVATSSGGYSFAIPWGSLPKTLLDRLDLNVTNKEAAKQNDIDELRLAIVNKLVTSYKSYKESHPGQQKHPGILIYTSVANQIFERYGTVLADIVNRKQVSDGKAGLTRSILQCTENKMRQKDKQPAIPHAVQASGVVGVLPEQYLPNVDGNERQAQEAIRTELQMHYNLDSDSWLWEDIRDKMLKSYELQRDDIATARVAIENALNNGEQENNEDEPSPKALAELMNLWPFLFYSSGLTWHHDRLTGRHLQNHLNEFLENHLEYAILFLTSCSKSNKKNLALGLHLDKKFKNMSVPQKFLKFFYMVGNHFGEDKFNFIHSLEKTAPGSELDTKGLTDICIVARDNEPFAAEQFFICTDEVVLMEVDCPQEAITSLVQLAFVLDLNYPKMPLTFEFLERFVFGMGVSETRVKTKKGKAIIVLTPSVRTLIKDLSEFETEMEKGDEDV